MLSQCLRAAEKQRCQLGPRHQSWGDSRPWEGSTCHRLVWASGATALHILGEGRSGSRGSFQHLGPQSPLLESGDVKRRHCTRISSVNIKLPEVLQVWCVLMVVGLFGVLFFIFFKFRYLHICLVGWEPNLYRNFIYASQTPHTHNWEVTVISFFYAFILIARKVRYSIFHL